MRYIILATIVISLQFIVYRFRLLGYFNMALFISFLSGLISGAAIVHFVLDRSMRNLL